jgi:hypothetical protein
MKTIFKIIYLRVSVSKLKGKIKHLAETESVHEEIEAREKLISILSKNSIKNFSSINYVKV